MNSEQTYNYFFAAFENVVNSTGNGFFTLIAEECRIAKADLRRIFDKENPEMAGFETQVKIAHACGYSYEDFLRYGKGILQSGSKENGREELPSHAERVEKILNAALEETGQKINDKQKAAVLDIIREEIDKNEKRRTPEN